MTAQPPSRLRELADATCRIAFWIGYRLALVWWFVRRPLQQGAYVAVWVGDELLLIRNSYKRGYTIPCGGIGSEESPIQAARRELFEEVGIETDESALLPIQLIRFDNEYKRDHAHVFELHLDTRPQIRIDRREVVWAAFVPREQLAGHDLVNAVERYVAGLDSVANRGS